ncbi:Transcription factor 25 [Vitis vinifera]|uniref:Transcription factor 25 n=1 Tax=Vitis vinifera TaxID=29760 RepID=A0A438DB49_VITVI|nr:Transcription factor 25 [Vitis vinifera]
MSARLLRKVLQEQEEQQQQQLGNDDDSDSPDPAAPPSKNLFHILNDDDDDAQGDESEIANETLTRNINEQETSVEKSTADVVSTSNHKSKKKKKKKGKQGSFSRVDKAEKPLDVILKTLSLDSNSLSNQPGSTEAKSVNVKVCDNRAKQYTTSILQVDPKFLSAENELRRIFGSKVVSSFENSQQTGSSRQIRGGRRGSHNPKKTILVSPSDHWPRWDGSLSMEFLESKDGLNFFRSKAHECEDQTSRYVHSSSYGQAQRAFEGAKSIHDLNSIASVLLYYPYHLDSLITMADYFKFVGEHHMSADATAKSLYALECAWNPMFTPLQGEVVIEEYAWLERFSEDYKSDNSLWLFPNFSYSLAICRFYLERDESSKDTHVENVKATSTDLMRQALMLHPSVLKKLVAKVPLKDQAWTNILKQALFKSEQAGSLSLDHLINIYVERSYIIWRLPDLQKLLRNAALLVIETLESNGSEARDWACVRKEVFSSQKNEYGHLLVSDFSDSVPTLPPDNLQNFMADPRMREEVLNVNQVVNPHGGDRAPRDIANRSPLAVLFESILPWLILEIGLKRKLVRTTNPMDMVPMIKVIDQHL